MKRRHGSGYAYSKTPRIGDEDAFLALKYNCDDMETSRRCLLGPTSEPPVAEPAVEEDGTKDVGHMVPFDASTQAVRNDPSHNCSKSDMQSLAAPVEEPAFVTLGQIAEQQQQQLQQQLQEQQQQPQQEDTVMPPPHLLGGPPPRSGLYAVAKSSSSDAGSSRGHRGSQRQVHRGSVGRTYRTKY